MSTELPTPQPENNVDAQVASDYEWTSHVIVRVTHCHTVAMQVDELRDDVAVSLSLSDVRSRLNQSKVSAAVCASTRVLLAAIRGFASNRSTDSVIYRAAVIEDRHEGPQAARVGDAVSWLDMLGTEVSRELGDSVPRRVLVRVDRREQLAELNNGGAEQFAKGAWPDVLKRAHLVFLIDEEALHTRDSEWSLTWAAMDVLRIDAVVPLIRNAIPADKPDEADRHVKYVTASRPRTWDAFKFTRHIASKLDDFRSGVLTEEHWELRDPSIEEIEARKRAAQEIAAAARTSEGKVSEVHLVAAWAGVLFAPDGAGEGGLTWLEFDEVVRAMVGDAQRTITRPCPLKESAKDEPVLTEMVSVGMIDHDWRGKEQEVLSACKLLIHTRAGGRGQVRFEKNVDPQLIEGALRQELAMHRVHWLVRALEGGLFTHPMASAELHRGLTEMARRVVLEEPERVGMPFLLVLARAAGGMEIEDAIASRAPLHEIFAAAFRKANIANQRCRTLLIRLIKMLSAEGAEGVSIVNKLLSSLAPLEDFAPIVVEAVDAITAGEARYERYRELTRCNPYLFRRVYLRLLADADSSDKDFAGVVDVMSRWLPRGNLAKPRERVEAMALSFPLMLHRRGRLGELNRSRSGAEAKHVHTLVRTPAWPDEQWVQFLARWLCHPALPAALVALRELGWTSHLNDDLAAEGASVHGDILAGMFAEMAVLDAQLSGGKRDRAGERTAALVSAFLGTAPPKLVGAVSKRLTAMRSDAHAAAGLPQRPPNERDELRRERDAIDRVREILIESTL